MLSASAARVQRDSAGGQADGAQHLRVEVLPEGAAAPEALLGALCYLIPT